MYFIVFFLKRICTGCKWKSSLQAHYFVMMSFVILWNKMAIMQSCLSNKKYLVMCLALYVLKLLERPLINVCFPLVCILCLFLIYSAKHITHIYKYFSSAKSPKTILYQQYYKTIRRNVHIISVALECYKKKS